MEKAFTINISGREKIDPSPELEIGFIRSLHRVQIDLQDRYPGLEWITVDFVSAATIDGISRPEWLQKGDTWQRSFRAKVRSLSNESSHEINGILVYTPQLGSRGRYNLDHVLIQ